MDRDWLKNDLTVALDYAEREGIPRDKWPDFLSQHAVNNWEMVEQRMQFQGRIFQAMVDAGAQEITRDTPEYYDRGE